jgi:hypothetical protein
MFTTFLKFDDVFTDLQFLNNAVREALDFQPGKVRNYTFHATERDNKTIVLIRCEEQLNDHHINWKEDNFDCHNGDELSVKVRANPIERVDGKHVNLTGKAARNYFRSMLTRAGLEVIRIKLSNVRFCIKREGLKDVKLLAQSFTADVRILDREVFLKAYATGIGRRKNVGFGMVQIKERKICQPELSETS